MLISATGNERFGSDAGVSLVEAILALFVVGLAVGVVLLLAPGPDHEVRRFAEQMAARIELASEESIITNRSMALVVDSEGYGFERLEANGWFAADVRSPLGYRASPGDIEIRIEQGDGEDRVARFDTIGNSSPARILVRGAGAEWRVILNEAGGVSAAPAE